MRNRKIFAVLICLAMIVALAVGCQNAETTSTTTGQTTTSQTTTASQGTSQTTTTEPPAEKVSLRYWALARWAGVNGNEEDGQIGDWQRDVAERYMAENPNVEDIEFEHVPGADIDQKLTVAIATSVQPNVLEDGITRGGKFARMDLLQPLNDYFTAEEMDDFLEGSWENGGIEVDGQYHMIPWSNSVQTMLINRTMFEEAGALDLLPQNEDRTWTYEEFRAAMEAVKSDSVYPSCFYLGSTAGDAYLYDFLMGNGVRLFDGDGNLSINTPETAETIDFIISMINDGLSVPGAETMVFSDDRELFKQQKTAVCFIGGYPQVKGEMDNGNIEAFEIGFAMYPNAEGKAPGLEANYIGYMVFKSESQVENDAAVGLAKFATNTENSKALKIVNLIPLRKSVGDLYPGDEFAAWTKRIFKYSEDPGYSLELYPTVTGEFIPMMQGLVGGDKTTEEALEDLEAYVISQ